MRTRPIFAVIITVALLAACGAKADPAACEAAMRADYTHALADPSAPSATKPAACNGLSDKQLQDIAAKVMSTP